MDYQSDAVAQVMREVCDLTDWLFGECHGTLLVGQRPHIKEASAEDFKHLTIPQLVALMFDAGQPAIVTQAARDAIANRYQQQPDTRARIDALVDRAETDEQHECLFDRIMGGSPLRSLPALRRAA